MIKKIVVLILLFVLLTAYKDESASKTVGSEVEKALNVEVNKLQLENKQLKKQISKIEKDLEEQDDALRTTMNLALRVFTALNNKDFEYISSISSPNVQVKEKESEIYFSNDNYSHKITNKDYLLENLEYRFNQFEDDKMTIGFAEYFLEGHSTIYFGFIKQDGEWLLDYMVTDA
ncbi:hypothetical protein [Psychrobacillus vulpis]|uniref:Uncharacterized protein n=1 Tax=Psychrobacillus vulpis TaxID=2325572 RepID=A0A544TNY0_9BACI|nr:hypothetical protein [Psychrobacillus vulpis]TQR19164.1 hypothetical protein FG384_14255 [Psychrobacillus vulpis]